MNVTIFKASRTAAREYAKQVQGKVKDMGSDAATGERWAVNYDVPDDVQVKEVPLMDHVVSLPDGAVLVAASPVKRTVMKLVCKKHQGKKSVNKGTMKNRKGNLIDVTFKRSKLADAIAKA